MKEMSTERFIYYRKYILQIAQSSKYRYAQLQYIFAVISEAPIRWCWYNSIVFLNIGQVTLHFLFEKILFYSAIIFLMCPGSYVKLHIFTFVLARSRFYITFCPRSSDPFHIVSYNIIWVTTSRTYCHILFLSVVGFHSLCMIFRHTSSCLAEKEFSSKALNIYMMCISFSAQDNLKYNLIIIYLIW